jgi:hypothetical protein
MSLHHIAKHLATKGRDEDKMLVHMTPREVAGLQQIAMAHGGSLTINPETGLAEAGFLKSILPMLAGAAATFFTGGAAAPWMAALAGGVTGAATGDKNQSLLMRMGMGALGGWGGGSLAAGLTKAGTSAVANQAVKTGAEQAVKTGASGLLPNGLNVAQSSMGEALKAGSSGVLQAGLNPALVANPIAGYGIGAGNELAKSAIGQGVKTAASGTAKSVAGNVLSKVPTGLARLQAAGTGLSQIGSEAGRNAIASGMYGGMGKIGLAAAAAPVVAAGATPPQMKGSKEAPPEYQMYSYNPGTVNPKFGEPGEPYFIGQGYSAPRTTNQNPYAPTYASYDKKGKPVGPAGLSPLEQYMLSLQQQQQPIAAAEGGSLNDYIAGMNEGKATSDPVGMGLNDYMANMNQQRAMNSSPMQYRPPNMAPVGDFTVRNPASGFRGLLTGMMDYQPQARMAQGGLASIGGYSDGGRLLRGPGDGVSDDIPASIHRDDGTKQEARLADGEFVFPARIVSEIGNGSTEAGAQKLYAAMDRIQRDRAGTLKDVAKDTNAIRHVESLV